MTSKIKVSLSPSHTSTSSLSLHLTPPLQPFSLIGVIQLLSRLPQSLLHLNLDFNSVGLKSSDPDVLIPSPFCFLLDIHLILCRRSVMLF